ncbi:MAG: AAC(3) family N-acetyltransferase [Anaerolineae bacterium]|nr:AAC(3) family N-acetyltransferase [Anaerolineae bacterium]
MTIPQTLQTDVLNFDIRRDSVLMVRASLRTLGQIPGSAETVI